MDPIEKKPLYHFYPGSHIFSIGSVGCNLKCGFCQNWQIAHGNPGTYQVTSELIVDTAQKEYEGITSIGIAYTYNEPFMWYEFIYDTAQIARDKGLKNVMVSNGYINKEPLQELLPFIDAMNIDVKGFTDDYYHDTCTGRLEPVLRTVEIAAARCQVEITTLLVPGLNDSREEITKLVNWLSSISPDIPLHFSRYFPNYEMDLPPTPVKTMEMAREIAREKLNYVYLGNVIGGDGANTYCPKCQQLLIERGGYNTRIVGLEGHKCSKCDYEIKIII
jgi:pyruvate formate lyase activating enzyme